MIHAGGCLCGGARYESREDAVDSGYCHCRMCQILSGSAVLPWASFSIDAFIYNKGEPKIYQSSSYGRREFCANCGSQIAFRATHPSRTIEINVGTLDDPERINPKYHIWCDSRIPWFETDDDAPRYPRSGPEGS